MAAPERVQLLTGEGVFNADEVGAFLTQPARHAWASRYRTVAIMGPQSSGKSTLLNQLFGTAFVEMDAMAGRSRTTQGVWLAQAKGAEDPPLLVLDLEGNDGRERGEDDTAFEKQAALFALAVSDVLMVNLWCHDIGREHGAGKPLLKTVLEVNLRLFDPERKTTLLFVIRDKSKTPMENLTAVLEKDLHEIWAKIPKPDGLVDKLLTDYFDIEYVGMSSFELAEDQFKADAAVLRTRLTTPPGEAHAIGGAGGDGAVPTDGLTYHMQSLWALVVENKDLDLPNHRTMVATVRCAEIAAGLRAATLESGGWAAAAAAAKASHAPAVGAQLDALMFECLQTYEATAAQFDVQVRNAKKEELEEKLLSAALPPCKAQLTLLAKHLAGEFTQQLTTAAATETFHFVHDTTALAAAADTEFAQAARETVPTLAGTRWLDVCDAAAGELSSAVATVTANVKAKAVAAATTSHSKLLGEQLHQSVHTLLDQSDASLWPQLRYVLKDVTERQTAALCAALEAYALDDAETAAATAALQTAARETTDRMLQDAVASVVVRMREKFQQGFLKTADGMARSWTASLDIGKVAKEAKRAAARVLALITVCQLDAADCDDDGDEKTQGEDVALVGPSAMVEEALCAVLDGGGDAAQKFGLPYWKGFEGSTLVQPPKCRELWRQFDSEVEVYITQAVSHQLKARSAHPVDRTREFAQEAARRANANGTPLWALVAILVLGFDEAMSLLYNPIYLILAGLLFIVCKNVYSRLNVEEYMAMGLVPGLIALAPKVGEVFLEYVTEVLQKGQQLADEQVKKREEAERAERVAAAAVAAAAEADGSKVASESHASAATSVSEAGLHARKTATREQEG